MSKDETKPVANAKDEKAGDSALITKLKQNKVQKTGVEKTTLPETGVVVTWPAFKDHGIWMKASRLAKGDGLKATNIYLPLLCMFDGEKMTIAEFNELLPTDDILHLTGEVMGDGDEDGGDEGNVLH